MFTGSLEASFPFLFSVLSGLDNFYSAEFSYFSSPRWVAEFLCLFTLLSGVAFPALGG